MTVSDILYIVYIVIAFLVGVLPSIIGFIQAAKARKKAKTIEEKAEAEKQLEQIAKKLIVDAEIAYKTLDDILKTMGETAGPYKKETVMAKLQQFALDNKITFDFNYWSEKVNEIVKLTKEVN